MLRILTLVSVLAVSAFTCLQAQAPGAAEWSNVPFTESGKTPANVLDAYCVDDVTYAFAQMVYGKQEFVGYIYPKNGPVVSRTVELDPQKGRYAYSAFCMVGNRPCVVYNTWDKKSGVVSVFVQAYTASGFEPDGEPIKLADLPLAKPYAGTSISLKTQRSPDGSKMLFLFDNIQQGGIKLALCWVLDRELLPVWSGQYRIPMQSYGSTSTSYFMDDGHLYMSVTGVPLTEDNVKEKKDGSIEAKTDARYWKHSDEKWYSMFGDQFYQWDCTVPGLAGAFDGTPVMRDGQVVMAGLMIQEQKKGEETQGNYVLLGMGENFTPEVIKSGRTPTNFSMNVRALKGEGGNIYLAVFQGKEVTMLKLNAAGELLWERTHPQASRLVNAVGDQVIFTTTNTKGTLSDLMEGKKVRSNSSGGVFPIMQAWDADGNATALRIFPEDAKLQELSGWTSTFDDCGCYIAVSTDKKRQGLVRVCVDK